MDILQLKKMVANKIREEAIGNDITPRRSGDLQGSIVVDVAGDDVAVVAGRGKAPYAHFVHGGTGLYGPLKQLIRPKNKKALAFKVNGQLFVRKSTKGMRANPFLIKAAKKAKEQGFAEVSAVLGKEVSVKIVRSLKGK